MAPRERSIRTPVYAIVTLLSLVSATLAFAVCGDGTVDPGEQCDPPCGTGCGAGQICNEQCLCEAQIACACGTPDPTQLKFTTALPSNMATGMLTPAKCAQCAIPSHCGNDCTTDDDCITRAAPSVAEAPSTSEETGPDECLVGVKDQMAGDVPDNGPLCAEAKNKKCTFNLAVCVNLSESGCAAGDIKRGKGAGKCGRKLKVKGSGMSPVCGAFVPVTVKTKNRGTAPGTCVVKVMAKTKGTPRRKDRDTVTLTCEPPGGCPTTTTTTTLPSQIIDRGTCRGPLTSGALYFGGGLVGVPLPNQVPDLGTSFTKTCCSGTKLVLAATTAVDTASEGGIRTCTSTDPTTPCLFGPPLPIPNKNNAAVSTCVINKIAQNAVGMTDCTMGASALSLPLTSEVYLLGDIDNEPANGIQPCPICNPNTLVCMGGSNDGMACTPADSAPDFPNGPYPTSHDCPPPPDRLIGTLPIGFALSTGTQTNTAFMTSAQQRAFCAYCFDDVVTSQFEQPPHACTSDGDCTTGNFTSCRQQSAHNGAFGNSAATTITEMGSPAGSLVDHMSHASTLVSVFCIPPTYNPIIDPTADLPGPGAVSLPGSAQLLP